MFHQHRDFHVSGPEQSAHVEPGEQLDECECRRFASVLSWRAVLDLWLLAEVVALWVVATLSKTFGPTDKQFSGLVPLLWTGTFALFAWSTRSQVLAANGTFVIRRHILDWTKSALLVLLFFYSTGDTAMPPGWQLYTFFGGVLVISAIGLFAQTVIFALSESGAVGSRIAIYGCGEGTQDLLDYIASDRGPAAHITHLYDERAARGVDLIKGYPISRDFEKLVSAAQSGSIDAVMINLPATATDRINDLVHRLERVNVDIVMAPSRVQILTRSRAMGHVGSIPTVAIYQRPMRGMEAFTKIIIDRVLAVIGLVIASPLLIGVCLLIRLESPGPVIFRQKRRGMNNQPFQMLKLRTMYTTDAPEDTTSLVKRKDPRVTRVGALLRRTSLDELPQLYNVLIGDMSLVGPRPHLWEAKAADRRYEEVVKRYPARHRVLPGITGLAQVRGYRGNGDDEGAIVNRVRSDLEYIDRWSVSLDASILVRTLVTFIFHRAY